MLSVGVLAGCGSKNTTNNSKSKVEGCSNCVFSVSNNAWFGKYGDVLENYSNDYTSLKDENGDQRKYFLGYVIDSNSKILKAYACGIVKNQAFCLEASKDGSTFESNKSMLEKLYGEDNCSMVTSNILQCSNFDDGQNLMAEIKKDGSVGVIFESRNTSCSADGELFICNGY